MASSKFVRASKFRHVHGEPARKDKCFLNVRAATNGDGDYIHANNKWIGFMGSGGGGPLHFIDRTVIGRLAQTVGQINVHGSKLLDFAFNPFDDDLVATAGEDASIRLTRIPDEIKTGASVTEALLDLKSHQKKVAGVQFHPTASNVLASFAFDHTVKIWDVEKGAAVLSFEHTDIPQSFGWNGNGSLCATVCKDKRLHIFDPRQHQRTADDRAVRIFEGAKPARVTWITKYDLVAVIGHNSGGMRQILLHDPRKMGDQVAPLFTTDLDQSAGQIMSHFDEDTGVLFLGGKGDAAIRYFEITPTEPPYFLSEFRSAEPQKGLCFLPKRTVDVSTCEIAAALRLMKDYIEPVSFQVPRKSDVFQEDIFPDAYAGVPAQTHEDYLSGKNAHAVRTSMKPGAAAPVAAGPAAPKKKSYQELEAELAAAQKTIAELQLKLAAK